jgi:hypothetical protein
MYRPGMGFAVGLFVGAAVSFVATQVISWRMSGRSPREEALYDQCLIGRDGNVMLCDAYIRELRRLSVKKTPEFKFSAACQAEMEKADQKLAEYKRRNVLPTADEAFPECVERERKAYEQSPNRNPP